MNDIYSIGDKVQVTQTRFSTHYKACIGYVLEAGDNTVTVVPLQVMRYNSHILEDVTQKGLQLKATNRNTSFVA